MKEAEEAKDIKLNKIDQESNESSSSSLDDKKQVQKNLGEINKVHSLQPQMQKEKDLIEMAQKLLDQHKQLEEERIKLMSSLKKEVQHPGMNILQKFSSFGNQGQGDTEVQVNQRIMEDLNQKLLSLKQEQPNLAPQPPATDSSHNTNALTMNILANLEQNKSVDNVEEEKRKVLIETLEQQKQNHELTTLITSKLDEMMINYSPGFILQMSLEEKQRLKEMILQIDTNHTRQIQNEKQKEDQYRYRIFKQDILYGIDDKKAWSSSPQEDNSDLMSLLKRYNSLRPQSNKLMLHKPVLDKQKSM